MTQTPQLSTSARIQPQYEALRKHAPAFPGTRHHGEQEHTPAPRERPTASELCPAGPAPARAAHRSVTGSRRRRRGRCSSTSPSWGGAMRRDEKGRHALAQPRAGGKEATPRRGCPHLPAASPAAAAWAPPAAANGCLLPPRHRPRSPRAANDSGRGGKPRAAAGRALRACAALPSPRAAAPPSAPGSQQRACATGPAFPASRCA